MKKILIRLTIIIIVVIVILGMLMATAELPNVKNNGFSRSWVGSTAFEPKFEYELKEPVSRIIGVIDSVTYLSSDNPNAILALSTSFKYKDTIILNYNLPPEKSVPFTISSDSSNLYWHFNNMSMIIHGRVPGENLKLIKLNAGLFIRAAQISPKSVVLKGFDSLMSKQVLKKVDMETGEILFERDALDNSADGSLGTSTDGMLLWNSSVSQLVNVEFFRNRVVCMDSNLNVTMRFNTIDTISTNHISLSVEKENDTTGKLAPETTRAIVNKDAFLDATHLYIISGLRADNESIKEYNRNVNIDVYDILTGKYNGTIRVRKEHDKAFKSAYIYDGRLLALYDKKICVYALPL